MKISEIENKKPKTAAQLKIDTLKQNKDKAMDAYKAEKDRQKKQKAREKIVKAQQTLFQTSSI